jgi:large subunit ribosomal protein L18
MEGQKVKMKRRRRRHLHVRHKVSGTPERPRLSVYRSLEHVYAQIVDDTVGRTLAAVSTLTPEVRQQAAKTGNKAAAALVGRRIAQVAIERGITQVAFDRGAFKYHGRVKELAEAARKGGLKF